MFELKTIIKKKIKYKNYFDLFKSADSNSCIWQRCISTVYVYIDVF